MYDLPSMAANWMKNEAMFTRTTKLHRRLRRGFTLVEAAIVTAIVGVGIVALLELLAAGSMSNINSKQLSTSVFLANNINELMQGKDYWTLKSTFDNQTYNPPRDGRGQTLVGFDDWSQVVDVSYVLPNRLTTVVPDAQVEPTARVTVSIVNHQTRVIYTTQWIIAAPD
jgi:type II secretory pathway pseudopilin PulG